jgi:type I restriction enzyme S subunit
MSFPRYPEYKDSGVEWLGAVPGHWQVKRIRHVAQLNPSKTEIKQLDPEMLVSFLPMEAVGDAGSLSLERETTIAEAQSGYTYFREGDVTYAKITPCFENGKGAHMRGLLNGIGFGSTELVAVRPDYSQTTSEYLNWIFRSPVFRRLAEASMYGAGGQKRVPDDFTRDFALGFPNIEEQVLISRFLSIETAKLDNLMAEQEKLIALLKEKRQAVIAHAVTKGLDPTVPMRDSGVDWLGEVPAHWQVQRMANLFTEVVESGDDSLPVLSVSIHSGVSDKELNDSELDRKVTRSDDRGKYKKVQLGDLVYNMMRAWQGGFGSVTVRGQVSPAYVVARPIADFFTAFVEQTLRTPQAVEEMRRHSQGVTDFRLRLYWQEFKCIQVALPDKEEQEAILAFIAAVNGKLQQAIDLLKERRTALISAAVTGQIDVRGLVKEEQEQAA